MNIRLVKLKLLRRTTCLHKEVTELYILLTGFTVIIMKITQIQLLSLLASSRKVLIS